MAEITDDQWEEFIEVVYKVVKKHPETSFVDLMAMKLDSDVYDDFQKWKLELGQGAGKGLNEKAIQPSSAGMRQVKQIIKIKDNCIILGFTLKVRYVLNEWKAGEKFPESTKSLSLVIKKFDDSLSSVTSAKELRQKVHQKFEDRLQNVPSKTGSNIMTLDQLKLRESRIKRFDSASK